MSEGIKFDQGKPRPSLIPPGALMEVIRVFTFGAHKYGDYNWDLGMNDSRLDDAGDRHKLLFRMGEDLDSESKLCHLAHSIANDLMRLQFFLDGRKEIDDRYFAKKRKSDDSK